MAQAPDSNNLDPTKILVCLTGFDEDSKQELTEKIKAKGYNVAAGVTKKLTHLLIGEVPGPKKIEKAVEQDVIIISEESLDALLEQRFEDIVKIDGNQMLQTFREKPEPKKRDTIFIPPKESYCYACLDVETADSANSRICSIGIVRLLDGQIIDTFYSLIDPECDFSSIAIGIHKISKRKVNGCPKFSQIWSTCLNEILNGVDFVGAFNAVYDASVLTKCCKHYEMQTAHIPIICAKKGAKHLGANGSLPEVCKTLELEMGKHHHSLDDAQAAARIMMKVIENKIDLSSLAVGNI